MGRRGAYWEAAKQFLRENYEFVNWQFYKFLMRQGASVFTARTYLSLLVMCGLAVPHRRRGKTIIYRSKLYATPVTE